MKDWTTVFECYPTVNLIYVVNGMPFLERGQADVHAKHTGKPVETVERGKQSSDSQAENDEGQAPPAQKKRKGKKA